jgi:hypothetical protein
MYDTKITVNGEEIKLTDFPREIITDVILAMLATLKGVEEIKEVVIEMKK